MPERPDSPAPTAGPPERRAGIASDQFREFLVRAVRGIWDSLGPGGRQLVRELQRAQLESGEPLMERAVREWLRELTSELRRAQLDPDILVFGGMPADAADRLIARRSTEATVIANQILAIHEDPAAVQEIECVLASSSIAAPHAERLRAGLAALREPGISWSVPCDLLLGAVEGLVWEIAESRAGLEVDREGQLRDHAGRPVRSVNGALRLEEDSGLSPHVRQFLDGRCFAGQGHSVRHRRRATLQREWTAYALVGIRGLLDDVEGSALIAGLAERLSVLGPDPELAGEAS